MNEMEKVKPYIASIIQTLQKYVSDVFFVCPNIDPVYLAGASKHYGISEDAILGLSASNFDAKIGFVVCVDGIYGHMLLNPSIFVSWKELCENPIISNGFWIAGVKVGFGKTINSQGKSQNDLIALFSDCAKIFPPNFFIDEGSETTAKNICYKFHGTGFYVYPTIDSTKLQNMVNSFKIPPEASICAIIDETFFGSATEGFAFTSSGIFSNFFPGLFYSWEEINSFGVFPNGADNVQFGSRIAFRTNFGPKQLDLIALIKELAVFFTASQGWHLNFDGKQHGPFSKAKVIEMLEKGALSPYDLAWKEGMDSWQTINSLPEISLPKESSPVAFQSTFFASSPDAVESQESQLDPSEVATALDVHLASESELSALPGIGIILAKKIIKIRRERNFTSFEDFGQTMSLKPFQMAKLKKILVGFQAAISQSLDESSDSRLDINKAAFDEILILPGMTKEKTELLIREREQRVGFASLEEIRSILNLPPHLFDKIRRIAHMGKYVPKGHVSSASGRIVDF
ncbi:hypothetical protein MASR1M12_31410 [Erysipelotrichia bacterium]